MTIRSIRRIIPMAFAPLLLVSLFAGGKEGASPEMKPLMTLRGKLLFNDDFPAGPVNKSWRIAKGQWDIVDGALKGIELKTDKHAAVVRNALDYRDAIFQFSFRLDGGKQISLSLNNKNGHVCRVVITPAGFTVNKDRPNAKSEEKAALLATRQTPLNVGQWYTMLVEVQGNQMLARIDDTHYALGEHDGINVDKADFGLPVAGAAAFDNIRVWEALPNRKWNKQQLDHLSKK